MSWCLIELSYISIFLATNRLRQCFQGAKCKPMLAPLTHFLCNRKSVHIPSPLPSTYWLTSVANMIWLLVIRQSIQSCCVWMLLTIWCGDDSLSEASRWGLSVKGLTPWYLYIDRSLALFPKRSRVIESSTFIKWPDSILSSDIAARIWTNSECQPCYSATMETVTVFETSIPVSNWPKIVRIFPILPRLLQALEAIWIPFSYVAAFCR